MKKIKEEYFYTNDEFYSIINDIITNDELDIMGLPDIIIH